MVLSNNKGFQELKEVASWPCFVIGLTASMGGFLFGADTGQISGFIIMDDYKNRFAQFTGGQHEFSNARLGLIVGMLSIGSLCGSLISAPIGNRIGRRLTIIGAGIVFYIGCTVQITAMYAWFQIMIGRIITGLAIGTLSVQVPVYVSETVPKQLRGALVSAYQLFITLGILISYCINLGTSRVDYMSASWRGALAISYLWAGILIVGMLFLPETPRFLVSKDRHKDAIRALRFIAGKKNAQNKEFIDTEFNEIFAMVMAERNMPKSKWYEAFKPKEKILYRTILGFLLQSFQQLTGANFFFYYGASVFQSVGISNSYVTQIILGAVNTVCTFPGLWFVERFGRRKPLIFGGLWQFAWLVVYGTVGTAGDPQDHQIGATLIVASCLFIASFASTWGPGVWVAIGEIFPLRVRSQSAALATAGNWIWNFLLTFFTPFIVNNIGYKYGYVFAGCNLLAALTVFFFYYESSGLSLEQIDIMYNDPHCKPWKSSNWIPPGHSTRTGAPADVIEGGGIDEDLERRLTAESQAHLEKHFSEDHYRRNDDMLLKRDRTVEQFV